MAKQEIKLEEPTVTKLAKRDDLSVTTDYSTSMKSVKYQGKVVMRTYLTDDNLIVKEALDIINGTTTI